MKSTDRVDQAAWGKYGVGGGGPGGSGPGAAGDQLLNGRRDEGDTRCPSGAR